MKRRPIHFYSKEEIEYLRKITPRRYNKEITKMFNEKFGLNISEKAISGIRKRHGIKTGFDGCFEKGHMPWNKGKTGHIGPNKTSFKKGNIPSNYRPVGSERVNVEGYVEVKTADPNVWEYKHVKVWKKHSGPVPEGHAIIFGDGDKMNFDIDNLICVSRRQLLTLNRHGLIQEDTELTKTGIIVVDVYHKIADRERAE